MGNKKLNKRHTTRPSVYLDCVHNDKDVEMYTDFVILAKQRSMFVMFIQGS